MKSKIDAVYVKHDGERICQGDILRDIEYVYDFRVEAGSIKTKKIMLPYVVVLSQDCDLERDYKNRNGIGKNQDKYLQSILVCPAYLAEKMKAGTHLSELSLTMERINGEKWGSVTNNDVPRYHYLNGCPDMQIPDLAIDFKHYFTIPRETLYAAVKDHCLGTVNELFREDLSQRFAYYLSRIGLPSFGEESSPERLLDPA